MQGRARNPRSPEERRERERRRHLARRFPFAAAASGAATLPADLLREQRQLQRMQWAVLQLERQRRFIEAMKFHLLSLPYLTLEEGHDDYAHRIVDVEPAADEPAGDAGVGQQVQPASLATLELLAHDVVDLVMAFCDFRTRLLLSGASHALSLRYAGSLHAFYWQWFMRMPAPQRQAFVVHKLHGGIVEIELRKTGEPRQCA